MKADRAKCKNFTISLLEKSKTENYQFGIVKSNFILGYIEKKNGDYGKSVIYYLEGIRHAENADYEGISRDLIYLFQNTGNIFKKFGNYDLAQKYYSQAMAIAAANEDFEKYTYLVILSAKVLKEEKKYAEAVRLLKNTFSNFNFLSKETVADVYNQLGGIYTQAKEKSLAFENYQKLINFAAKDSILNIKYSSRAYHNLGHLHFQLGEYENAVKYYNKAVILKELYPSSPESLFRTYKDLAESYVLSRNYDSAEIYVNKAEVHYKKAINIPNFYELYKFKSQIKRENGDLEGYAINQSLYATSLENYLAEQREIETTDKKYNLDLITQRYFALVAEQDRNQQIQYYSTVGGSVLVSLILLIITFFQYRKYRLRKDLEASLKPYIKDAL